MTTYQRLYLAAIARQFSSLSLKSEDEFLRLKLHLNMLESILVGLTKQSNLEKAHALKRNIERMKARMTLMQVSS